VKTVVQVEKSTGLVIHCRGTESEAYWGVSIEVGDQEREER
jgi:hypothetical protein